ncbi:MAG: GrpB family protein [Phenylobacterium sp.]
MSSTNPLPGLLPGKVFLTEPSPQWAQLYAQEQGRIARRLGAVVVAIEHYGSTSIPGIKAKPVIDLLIGVRRLDDALDCAAAMEQLGYDFAAHAGVPQHHVYGKGAARTHLAHFVEHGGEAWRECLAFRDSLRADPAKARAYEALKLELAEKYPDDRAAYTAGKSAFVAKVLDL